MTRPEEAAIEISTRKTTFDVGILKTKAMVKIQLSSAHLVVKSRALVCVVLQCELRSSVAGLAYVADQLAGVQARFNS